MSNRFGRTSQASRLVSGMRATNSNARLRFRYLIFPLAIICLISALGFRHTAVLSLPHGPLDNPLHLPIGWPMPPIPADNPITNEKFELGRYLFFETALSGDNKTSCGTCHNPRLSFAGHGSRGGAFGDTSKPARNVPRLLNLAYDSVLTWDGHIRTLEEQVHIAVLKKGDLKADTTVAFSRLANNPAYTALFTRAFGDAQITLDRIAKAIATFERCLISANSLYDQYMNGDSTALSASAQRGMTLFFDTTKTNCAFCHNNLSNDKANGAGQIFSDNNYYRTGTFEPDDPRSGYGFNPAGDTLHRLDAGRASVTKDSMDIGKFRTPTLRNLALTPPFGASGSVQELSTLLMRYNRGGDSLSGRILNKDRRIKPLHLTASEMNDLAAFLNSLTDVSFISNPAFQNPGAPTMRVDDRLIAGRLSLYPNPAVGFVNVDCPDITGDVEATLISERGVSVWHHTLASNGKLLLDFGAVANGAYLLELRSANARQAVQLVIRH